jgi:hypothetical protein
MSDSKRKFLVYGLLLVGVAVLFAPVDYLSLGRIGGRAEGVAMVYESSTGIPGAFLSAEVESYLATQQVEYRRMDKDATFSDADMKAKWQPYLASAGTLPSIVVKRGTKYAATQVNADDSAALVSALRKAVGK